MSYLKKALLPGEVIDQRLKFSNMAQFGAPTVEFVVIVVVWWVARHAALDLGRPYLPQDDWVDTALQWAYWVGLGLFTGRFVWRMAYRALRLQFRELAVTNRRFVEKDGVFNVQFWSTDLEKIVRVSIAQPILGRVFNFGAVTIVTVGEVVHTTTGIAGPIALQTAVHARMQSVPGDNPGASSSRAIAAAGQAPVSAEPSGGALTAPVSRPGDV